MRSHVLLLVAGCCLLGVSWAAPRSLDGSGSSESQDSDHEDEDHEALTVEVFEGALRHVMDEIGGAMKDIQAFAQAAKDAKSDEEGPMAGLKDLRNKWEDVKEKGAVMGNVTRSLEIVAHLSMALFTDSSGFKESNVCEGYKDQPEEDKQKTLAQNLGCLQGVLAELADDKDYKLYKDDDKVDEEEAINVVLRLSQGLTLLYMEGRRILHWEQGPLPESEDESGVENDESGGKSGDGEDKDDMKRIVQLFRRLLKEKRGLGDKQGKRGEEGGKKPGREGGNEKPDSDGGDNEPEGEDEDDDKVDEQPYSLKRQDFFGLIDHVFDVINHVNKIFTDTKQAMENEDTPPEEALKMWRGAMYHAGGMIRYKLAVLVHVLFHLHYNEGAKEIIERASCVTNMAQFSAKLDREQPQAFLDTLVDTLNNDLTCFVTIMQKKDDIKSELEGGEMTEMRAVGLVHGVFRELHLARLALARFARQVDAAMGQLDGESVKETERELLKLLKRKLDQMA